MIADHFIDPFYACQVPNVRSFGLINVEKCLILIFSEGPFFEVQSVRLEFLFPPKQ